MTLKPPSRTVWQRLLFYGGVFCFLALLYCARWRVYGAVIRMTEEKKAGQKTVAQRVAQFGSAVDQRLKPYFTAQGVSYPPERLVFVGIKKDNQLEVYAAGKSQELRLIRTYPILCASGKLGPKLKEGDRQVPEGLYAIQLLNPNSLYHLSLRVNYPNDFDHAQAAKDGRTELGGDIMIHGKNVSIGCLAMGDEAAEDLFILAARTGLKNIRVILTPVDFRKETVTAAQLGHPAWVQELYTAIARELPVLR